MATNNGLHTESTWQQGAYARRRGEPITANPYRRFFNNFRASPVDMDYYGWTNGWKFVNSQFGEGGEVELP